MAEELLAQGLPPMRLLLVTFLRGIPPAFCWWPHGANGLSHSHRSTQVTSEGDHRAGSWSCVESSFPFNVCLEGLLLFTPLPGPVYLPCAPLSLIVLSHDCDHDFPRAERGMQAQAGPSGKLSSPLWLPLPYVSYTVGMLLLFQEHCCLCTPMLLLKLFLLSRLFSPTWMAWKHSLLILLFLKLLI